jgi:mono/diheme cytochrome c family protein
MRNCVFLCAALCFGAFVALAQQPARSPAQQPARRPTGVPQGLNIGAGPAGGYGPLEPESIARGKDLFVGRCAFCHGSNGTGGEGGPDLIRSPLVLRDRLGSTIAAVVLNGRGGMPKFDLTKAQIADISEFLHAKMVEKTNRGRGSTIDIVSGNAKAGQEYFASHCASCHSPTGDLAHVAAKYEPHALQGRFLYPGPARGFVRPGAQPNPTTVTVTDPSGKTVSGTLVRLDDFIVALTDSEGQFHSWRRDALPDLKVQVHDPRAAHEKLLEEYSNADMHNVLAYLETLK